MSDPIIRLNAALEGRYTIEREGGMATVGYDIHPDGGRFLFARSVGGAGLGDFHIVTAWFEELKQRMGN